MPLALNCNERPSAKLVCGAVTVMLCRTAEVTVSSVCPVMELSVALIVDTPVMSGVPSPVLLIVATLGAEELHCTWEVMLDVVPSL